MEDEVVTTESTLTPTEAAPEKKRKKPMAKKVKTKVKAKTKSNGAEGGIASQFGIREGGERAAILEVLAKPLGKKRTAAELAKLTASKSTTRVAGIVARIEKKAKKYKTGYKVLREDTDNGRVYALHR